MTPELVVLDMAGTTVVDDGLVVRAFIEAIGSAGVSEEDDRFPKMLAYVEETMGQSKITVFRALLGEETAAQAANAAFERAYARLVAAGECTPVDGAEDVIRALRADGVKVAFGTGFAPATQTAILDALGWLDLADLVLAPGEGVRGRPFPDLHLPAADCELRAEVPDGPGLPAVGDSVGVSIPDGCPLLGVGG